MAHKVPVSGADRRKSYFKYYEQDVEQGDAAKHARVDEGPFDNALCTRVQDRADLFKPGELPGEFGWWLLEDGTAATANDTFMPGVTAEMFDWWFAWHPIDRLRYAIWDSEDHYDVYLDDPARALDDTLTVRERHWGSVHHVWEDAGVGHADLLQISFKRPGEMGYDESLIGTDVCFTIVCANGLTLGSGPIPDSPAVMTHFLRPVEGGSVLRSRFWMGWRINEQGEAEKGIPDGVSIPAPIVSGLLHHNIKEFANLARILPSLYAEEKDRWAK